MTRRFHRRKLHMCVAAVGSGALLCAIAGCSSAGSTGAEESGASGQLVTTPAAPQSDGTQSVTQSGQAVGGNALADDAVVSEDRMRAAVAATTINGRSLAEVPNAEATEADGVSAALTGAEAETDLPADVIDPRECGSILWRPHTFGALSAQWPNQSLYLPQEGDAQVADIKGVFVTAAPSVGDATQAVLSVEDLIARCPQYTLRIGGTANTALTLSRWNDAGISDGWIIQSTQQDGTAESDVTAGARIANVLISVGPQPADRLDEAKALVSQIAGQLANQ